MGCTCGSSGALDGHSPFCDLRKVERFEAPNRVIVGLPDRLAKTQIALREAETMIEEIRKVVGAWKSGDTYLGWTHNAMKEIERIIR